ncbi:MAG: prolipoprotein diacylglyceryl transferase [Deltaproteobacteria bacterium]|nr:prolipoprotein diacylglyceryl transferase [Deltaproteobacteria bacterium]
MGKRMMIDEILVGGMALAYIVILVWSCRVLPGERWQVLATMPLAKNEQGWWRGLNITYYGFFQACAFTAALSVMLVMLGSVRMGVLETLSAPLLLLAVCVPASKLVARLVEKKPQTLTVAGASFVGLVLCPWLILGTDALLERRGSFVMPILAAVAVSYAFGEGLGRLACISFGCCYGKPLDACSPLIRRLFRNRGFVFTGDTKKIAYAGGPAGRPVIPVQALTSGICVGVGLIGFYLFLRGWFTCAFLLVILVTQGWRAYSETLRDDFRGGGKVTAYQWMAAGAVVYGGLTALWAPAPPALTPDVVVGLSGLWNPAPLLGLEALWLIILVYYGRSKVTASTIRFHVVQSEV